MAAAVVRSFEVDMEKVSVLVKMIAAFQSVQGVSAKLAEESEEQGCQHMVIYGVFMAVLGASVYHLIRYWWERRGGGHERTEEDHGRKEDRVVETGPIKASAKGTSAGRPKVAAMRVQRAELGSSSLEVIPDMPDTSGGRWTCGRATTLGTVLGARTRWTNGVLCGGR